MKFGTKKSQKATVRKSDQYTKLTNTEFENMCYDLSKRLDKNRQTLVDTSVNFFSKVNPTELDLSYSPRDYRDDRSDKEIKVEENVLQISCDFRIPLDVGILATPPARKYCF